VNLDGYALPIKKLKGTEPVESLDLSRKGHRVASAIVIASLIGVNGGLTELSLAENKLGKEGTKFLCDALVGNNTLKELDLSGEQTYKGTVSNIGGTAGAKHVAKMLLVNGGLTKLSLRDNELGEEGTKAICEALEQNKTLKELGISGNRYTSSSNIGGSASVKHVSKMLGVNGGLTSINLWGNMLGDEGWGAIFAAICGNKDSKIMSIYASDEHIGPAGVKLIAEALRTSVTGALTEVWETCQPTAS